MSTTPVDLRAIADRVAKDAPDLVVALRVAADRVAAVPYDSTVYSPDYSIRPKRLASLFRVIADRVDPIVDAIVAAVRDGATASDAAIAFNAFRVINTVIIDVITMSFSDHASDAAKKKITDAVSAARKILTRVMSHVQTAIYAALGAAIPGDFVVAARAALGAAADRVAEDAAALVPTDSLNVLVSSAADVAARAVATVRNGVTASEAARALFKARDVAIFKVGAVPANDLSVDAAIAGRTATTLASAIRTVMER